MLETVTMVSSSVAVNRDRSGRGTTHATPSLTAPITSSNSCNLKRHKAVIRQAWHNFIHNLQHSPVIDGKSDVITSVAWCDHFVDEAQLDFLCGIIK